MVVLLLSVSLVGPPAGYYSAAQDDTKADEYAVYSAVVSSMSKGTKLVVINIEFKYVGAVL